MTREEKLYVFSWIRTIAAAVSTFVNLYVLWVISHHQK